VPSLIYSDEGLKKSSLFLENVLRLQSSVMNGEDVSGPVLE